MVPTRYVVGIIARERTQIVPKPPHPTNKGVIRDPEPLTIDELRALLAATTDSNSGVRAAALIAVMYGAGLRISETLALRPRDVDLPANAIYVRRGKGGKPRQAGLAPEMAPFVRLWLERRKSLGMTGSQPVFAQYTVGRTGQPLSQRYVRMLLARLAAHAGIEKPVRPHGLRHTLATTMSRGGYTTPQIQAVLGHERLSTTETYIKKLTNDQMLATMRTVTHPELASLLAERGLGA